MTDNPSPSDTSSDIQNDEVSLRDLYLTLVRGLPIILILALLAGGGAYLFNARRQPVYGAESTVLVTPPPIEIQGDDILTFSPVNEITFQTYSTLARSQDVLREAVSELPGRPIAPGQLLSLGTLREVVPSSRPVATEIQPPLSVVHRVRNANPERAALLADAWAQSTLNAVRQSLFASLNLVNATTGREVSRLQEDVARVEARVQTFAASDNRTLLEAELEGSTSQLTEGRARLNELDMEIAATRARLAELERLLGGTPAASTGLSQPPSPALFGVLNAQNALDDATVPLRSQRLIRPNLERAFRDTLNGSDVLTELLGEDEDAFIALSGALEKEWTRTVEGALARERKAAQQSARAQAGEALQLALLGYASDQAAQPRSTRDALTLLLEAEQQREKVALQALIAEQQRLQQTLPSFTQKAADLQRQLATLDQQRERLDRELENVLGAYDTVAELQSSVSYLTELAPTNARILSKASVPSAPSGPRRGFNTVLSAILGALAGVVFVFLRAAVQRPSTRARKATS